MSRKWGSEPKTLEEAMDIIFQLEEMVRVAHAIDEVALFVQHTSLSPAQSIVLAGVMKKYPGYASKEYLTNGLRYERSVRNSDKDVWEDSIFRVHMYRVRTWFRKNGVLSAIKTGLVGHALTGEGYSFLSENYPKLVEATIPIAVRQRS